jgi:hypothetical protein
MASWKSLDDTVSIIAAYLHDVQTLHGDVFNIRDLRLTLLQVNTRTRLEGLSFLTKTLPKLGKAFDKALAEVAPLNAAELRFSSQLNSKLPNLMGEFFNRVLRPDGTVLQDPCISSVRVIRQLTYMFYKYELPYTDEQEQEVVDRFTQTEDDISQQAPNLERIGKACTDSYSSRRKGHKNPFPTEQEVTREAKILLSNLFATFDPTNIIPQHGPGVVATKQQLWAKFQWTNVSERITDVYPFDAYFCASSGHVCDTYKEFEFLGCKDLPARVILVPKDSRGPRLISCEPVDFQWIQQGLRKAIVSLVENHPLSKWNVFFTDQVPNQKGALLGSTYGRYSTLDLNEASDRVSLDLVRLLFPEHLWRYLEAARSLSTVLPDGRIIKLNKFAPMGSALCFPILALSVWAILTAAMPDRDARESILVYGDDVIVPTAQAANAIEQLETFGLKVNREKSCTSGFFRESCGVDAFKGNNVTPVKLKTVWSSHRSPSVYTSWISYGNSFADRQCWLTYDLIVSRLRATYGRIPGKDMNLTCPSLNYVHESDRPLRRRTNKSLQKLEWYVLDVSAPVITKTVDGWTMLLRAFTEGGMAQANARLTGESGSVFNPLEDKHAFSSSLYTNPRTSELVRRWR